MRGDDAHLASLLNDRMPRAIRVKVDDKFFSVDSSNIEIRQHAANSSSPFQVESFGTKTGINTNKKITRKTNFQIMMEARSRG
jgi:hypothetical protein